MVEHLIPDCTNCPYVSNVRDRTENLETRMSELENNVDKVDENLGRQISDLGRDIGGKMSRKLSWTYFTWIVGGLCAIGALLFTLGISDVRSMSSEIKGDVKQLTEMVGKVNTAQQLTQKDITQIQEKLSK